MQRIYGHELNRIARKFTKELNADLSPAGLFSSQWGIILCLKKIGPATQQEISQYLCVEAPTITRTLTRLEEMGWVVRQAGADRRQRQVSLSAKAFEMFPVWQRASDQLEVRALQDINPEELMIFNRVLEQMSRNLES